MTGEAALIGCNLCCESWIWVELDIGFLLRHRLNSRAASVFEVVDCGAMTRKGPLKAGWKMTSDWNGKQARRSITSWGEQAEHVG